MEQSAMHAYLVQTNEPQAGRRYPLGEEAVTLGRASSNTLAFPGDDSISRQHAHILNRLGLLWLEDLGSTNGTFYTPPGSAQRQLAAHEPVLLLEGSSFRIGIRVSFLVKSVAASQDEATRLVRQRLQQMLLNLYKNLSQYPAEQQQEYLKAIRNLQERMAAARSEEELALLAAQGGQSLRESLVQTARFTPPVGERAEEESLVLPPLPDDLPDPGDPNRLRTLMNAFITDIRICFPNDHQQNERDH